LGLISGHSRRLFYHITPGEASAGEISRSLHAQGELKKLSRRLVDAQEQERRAISRELHDEVANH